MTTTEARSCPLGARIKELRKEAGWSQGELADKVGTDAREVSRYENGRITPSLDVLVRIARRSTSRSTTSSSRAWPGVPVHAPDHGLGERLAAIGELGDEDRSSLLNVIDALITKSRLKALAAEP